MRLDNDSKNGFKEIKPAPFSSVGKTPTASSKANSLSLKTRTIAFAMAALFISLIIAIFFLPRWVADNSTTLNPTVDTTPPLATNAPSLPIPASVASESVANPLSKDANMAFRKEAQTSLQAVLEKQKILEENNALVWAGEAYATGLNHTMRGDTFYNQQQFAKAVEAYQQALTIFNTLYDKMDLLYQENIARGLNALEQGDAALAKHAFETASLFTDASQQAAQGLERAQTLDAVFSNIEQGDNALADGRLAAAKKAYQTALELDPATLLAKQKLRETNRLLVDKQFNDVMSAGYVALDQGNFATALRQFNKALAIQPDADDAREALQQTRHQATAFDIANTLKKAAASEKNEQWQMAVDLYNHALTLEKNLAVAQTGKQRAQARLAIKQRLEKILSQPERLNDKKIHAEVSAYYNKIDKLDNKGIILAKQLADLEMLLQVSATPVKIRLQSDNLTDVVIYKVGDMGIFETKEMRLRPGKYVAVGRRNGYRDVRVEFVVSQETSRQIVEISAKEKIN